MHLNLREKNSEVTEIARPRTLSGIDALYFHIEVPYQDYSEFYNNIILSDTLSNDDLYTLQGHSKVGEKQYAYYSVDSLAMEALAVSDRRERQLCSIGFKNLNQKDNLPSIFVKMNTLSLHILGYKEAYNAVLAIIEGFGIPIQGTIVNRLDLNTYVFGHNFQYLRYNLFSTKMRNTRELVGYDTIFGKEELQTFYLGSRGSSVFMRIYNKLAEIHAKYDDGGRLKLGIISNRYELKYSEPMNFCSIWNVEFEIKREELKRYGINTVEDVWEHCDALHKDITCNRIRLVVPTNSLRKRCKSSFVWSLISDDYSLFKHNCEPLTPEKFKVYKTTIEKKLINHCNAYLDDIFKNDTFDTSSIQDVKNLIASLSHTKTL